MEAENKIQTAQPMNEIQMKYQEARYLAESDILPKHFIGKPGNVLVALEYARQLSNERRGSISPIAIMQNLYVVHGNCGLSAKFMIALANSSGKFDKSLKFYTDKSNPNNIAVECFSWIDGEKISYRVDMDMAKAEGWTKNTKYKTMPELMLSYRAASFLIRIYAPETVMGLSTEEDVKDIEYHENSSPIVIEDKAAKEEEQAPEKPDSIKNHVGFESLKKKVDELDLNNELNKMIRKDPKFAQSDWDEISEARFNGIFRFVMGVEKKKAAE